MAVVVRLAALMGALLATVLVIQSWPAGRQGEGPKQSLWTSSAASDRPCGKAILRDWAADGRIDGTYARSCYAAARSLVPEDGGGRVFVGGAALIEALETNAR